MCFPSTETFLSVPGEESGVVEELSVCGGYSPPALMRRLRGPAGAVCELGGGPQTSRGQAQLKMEKAELTEIKTKGQQ